MREQLKTGEYGIYYVHTFFLVLTLALSSLSADTQTTLNI